MGFTLTLAAGSTGTESSYAPRFHSRTRAHRMSEAPTGFKAKRQASNKSTKKSNRDPTVGVPVRKGGAGPGSSNFWLVWLNWKTRDSEILGTKRIRS